MMVVSLTLEAVRRAINASPGFSLLRYEMLFKINGQGASQKANREKKTQDAGREMCPIDEEPAEIISLPSRLITQVTQLHLESFAGYMNTRLGRSYIETLIRQFCEIDQRIALVAVDTRSNVLGYAVGARLDESQRLTRRLLLPAARGLLMHPLLLADLNVRRTLYSRVSSLMSHDSEQSELNLPRPVMALYAIAVSPLARRRNVGASLLRKFEVRSIELGMRSLMLSVYRNNAAAQRLYNRNGWIQATRNCESKTTVQYTKVVI